MPKYRVNQHFIVLYLYSVSNNKILVTEFMTVTAQLLLIRVLRANEIFEMLKFAENLNFTGSGPAGDLPSIPSFLVIFLKFPNFLRS